MTTVQEAQTTISTNQSRTQKEREYDCELKVVEDFI